VVAALVLAAERSPGQLGQLLGSLAAAARAEVVMRLRVEAGRARTRSSVRIITGCAIGFSLGLVVLNRPYLSAYDDLVGQVVLALVGACYAAAYWWLARASRAQRPERFLSNLAASGEVGS
jgi:tight adherence protein B